MGGCLDTRAVDQSPCLDPHTPPVTENTTLSQLQSHCGGFAVRRRCGALLQHLSDQLGNDVVARADKRATQTQAQKEGPHRTSSDRASGLISGGEMPGEMGMVSGVAQQQARE